MTAARATLKLIRRVQRRSAWCTAMTALPGILWVTAIVIALLLPVHFLYLPVDAWSTSVAAILIGSLWFVRAYAVNIPTRDQSACIADSWYDGKSLIATAFDLAKRNSQEPFAHLVADQANQSAKVWLAQPKRMPSPDVGWRAWLPATIAVTGLIFLLIPGYGPGNNAPGMESTGSNTTAASLSRGVTESGEASREQNQVANADTDPATGQLRALPITDAPDPDAIEAAMTAPDALQGMPSAAIAGDGDLPGADAEDTAFADAGVILSASGEIEIAATGERSTAAVTGKTNINELSVRYGPAQAQYAAAYFRELDQQGRHDE